MSYTVHRLILSYGLFIVSGCDLVCGAPCTWCWLCLVMWSDRTNCYVRSEDTSHWENPSELKRGCGAIWWLDMWYSAVCKFLFDCGAYYWVVQNVIPDWHRFLKWECGLYMLCGVLDCGCMGGLIDYVGLWDLCCDSLWHDNVIWFLSAVGCMVIWFGWSGLILYSLLYMGRLWECLFLWLSIWKLCRTLFSDICCWSCMVLWLCGYWAFVRCCWYIIVF